MSPRGIQSLVTRHFTLRWHEGLVVTRISDVPDSDALAESVRALSVGFSDAATQAGDPFVSVVDITALEGEPTPGPMKAVGDMYRKLRNRPVRRAIILGEGLAGDSFGSAATVITAGDAKLFRVAEIDAAIAYVLGAKTVDEATLRLTLERD